MWTTVVGWLAGAWAKILAVGAVVGAVAVVYFRIKQDGVDEQKSADMKQELKDEKIVEQVHTDVANMPDGVALDELHRDWQKQRLRCNSAHLYWGWRFINREYL